MLNVCKQNAIHNICFALPCRIDRSAHSLIDSENKLLNIQMPCVCQAYNPVASTLNIAIYDDSQWEWKMQQYLAFPLMFHVVWISFPEHNHVLRYISVLPQMAHVVRASWSWGIVQWRRLKIWIAQERNQSSFGWSLALSLYRLLGKLKMLRYHAINLLHPMLQSFCNIIEFFPIANYHTSYGINILEVIVQVHPSGKFILFNQSGEDPLSSCTKKTDGMYYFSCPILLRLVYKHGL